MRNSLHVYIKYFSYFYESIVKHSRKNNESNFLYRIVEMPTVDDPFIYFQIIGKSILLKAFPEKIMRDDILLGFSKIDILLITHCGTKNEVNANENIFQKKIFKISKEFFSFNKKKFLLKDDFGGVVEKEAAELLNDAEILKNITGSDGVRIGYSAAEEHFKKIEFLRQIKE